MTSLLISMLKRKCKNAVFIVVVPDFFYLFAIRGGNRPNKCVLISLCMKIDFLLLALSMISDIISCEIKLY